MTSTEKEIFVLYGSQTGNAESIAKELNTKLKDEFKSHGIFILLLFESSFIC